MFHSILITGGTSEKKLNKAKDIFSEKNNLTIEALPADRQELNNEAIINNPDFILIKPEDDKSIGIKKVRILKKKISRKPFQQKYKIIFIKNAESLTIEAQNALLKTLEEPPSHTIIILSVPCETSLLPTIQSRCRIFHLPREKISPPSKDSPEIQVLEKILKSAKMGERIELIKPYTKTNPKTKTKAREHALNFCQKSLVFLSSSNPNSSFPSNSSNPSLFLILKSLQSSHNLLKKNINVKLVMENMVMEW